MIRFAAAIVIGGCAAEPTTTLAELQAQYGETTIEVVARGQVNVQLHVAPSMGCPQLGELRASFNGEPMQVSRGGYDLTANGCYPIAFWFNELPRAVVGIERAQSGSQVVIEDASASWRINTSRLFATAFELDTAASRIVWHDVAEIATARVSPIVPVEIDGNVISYPAGTTIKWVTARAHPAATRCEGPALCVVNLESEHSFPIAP